MNPTPEQGDVYGIALEGQGHEQRGFRYAVVVSDGAYNELSTVVVVPLSTSSWDDPLHPVVVVNGVHTKAMVEQVRAVDKRRLGRLVGSLAGETVMDLVLEQLTCLFALDR